MVQINFGRREVNCKLVYYGPGLSGKTTNLEVIHQRMPEDRRGALTSIATEQDRTLFFDFMALDLGTIAGMKTKFHLYTVPGQVYYNTTRKVVLQGVDGIVFVADSGRERLEDNVESLQSLEGNLRELGINCEEMSLVLQYNKRDLPAAVPIDELREKLNPSRRPEFEAVAVRGEGVMQTLKGLAELVVEKLNSEYGQKSPPPPPKTPAVEKGPPAPPALPRADVVALPPAPPLPAKDPALEPERKVPAAVAKVPNLGPVLPPPKPMGPSRELANDGRPSLSVKMVILAAVAIGSILGILGLILWKLK